MKRSSGDFVRDLDARLRSEADGFRREPSQALQQSVRSAIANGAEKASLAPLDGPESSHPWRDRLNTGSVAAAVLVAAGLWIFALGGVLGGGATSGGTSAVVGDTVPAPGDAASPNVLVRLVRSAPDSWTTAVENPLLSELERIGQDATSAARFLVGRLPASLAANPREDGPR